MSQPAVLPPEFDPRRKKLSGLAVLGKGLPALPAVLDYRMAIPVASWTAANCAVVLFLEFYRDDDGTVWPEAMMMTYARDGGRWRAHDYHVGVGWSHDPIANPQDTGDDGQIMAEIGGSYIDSPAVGHPAAVVAGLARPDVADIALVQDGHEQRRPLHSYFGAWVVCTDHWSPYQIIAFDKDGAVLDSLQGPRRLPSPDGEAPEGHAG